MPTSNLLPAAVRAIMSSKVFIRFACVALVAAMIQASLISLPSAQTVSTQTTAEARTLAVRIYELVKAGKYAEAIPLQQRELAVAEKALGRLPSST